MSARILDGTRIANDIRTEVAAELEGHGLHQEFVLAWQLSSSVTTRRRRSTFAVRSKPPRKSASTASSTRRPKPRRLLHCLALVHDLNHRDEIDGILVQLPLPAHVDAKNVLMAVDPAKDC